MAGIRNLVKDKVKLSLEPIEKGEEPRDKLLEKIVFGRSGSGRGGGEEVVERARSGRRGNG